MYLINIILDYIGSLYMFLTVFIISITISLLVLIAFPFVYFIDKERHFLHKLAIYWSKLIQFVNPWWKFIIVGKENLAKKNSAVIYVANHQSQADILALFIVSTKFRWLAKDSLFKIPFFGWAMKAIGYVSVKRGNKKSSERCMIISARHLKNGTSMIFFPEGTRSKTTELGQFKQGAFRLSTDLGVPIVPITIDGCAKLLPNGSLFPKKATVTIHIHEPISSKNIPYEDLMIKCRNVISEQLEKNKLEQEGH